MRSGSSCGSYSTTSRCSVLPAQRAPPLPPASRRCSSSPRGKVDSCCNGQAQPYRRAASYRPLRAQQALSVATPPRRAISPHRRAHLLACQCCGRMTRATHTHQLQPLPLAATAALAAEEIAAAAASASAAVVAAASLPAAAAEGAAPQPLVYSFARCSHRRYPNLLLPGRLGCPDFALLDGCGSSAAPHPLVWPLPRVLALQVRIDADGAIAAHTAAYLAKLDEFRSLSCALPSSGSQQQQYQQQSRDHRRGSDGAYSGGAQLEESKQSQESSPPSSSSVNSVSSAVHASRVEQQLLHSRDELLQCVEARDKLAALALPVSLRTNRWSR